MVTNTAARLCGKSIDAVTRSADRKRDEPRRHIHALLSRKTAAGEKRQRPKRHGDDGQERHPFPKQLVESSRLHGNDLGRPAPGVHRQTVALNGGPFMPAPPHVWRRMPLTLSKTDLRLASSELLTIRDFLRFAVSRFNAAGLVHGHGVTNALDDAAFLILETLHLPVDQLEPWLDARLLPAERKALVEMINLRVMTRKPSAYLVQKAYIHGVPFYVDERVIVPRSYLGEMLAGELADDLFGSEDGSLISAPENVTRILDLCTGSGCLAILAAMRFPFATVDAVELSADAMAVAKKNVADHGLEARVRILKGDLFKPVKGERYDLIIANPPYVAREVVEAFPAEYAAEPRMAHLGGDDGLDLVRRIIAGAAAHLTPDGGLLCEIGEDRELLEVEYPDMPFLWLDSAESEGEVFWIGQGELV
jgi:ribosomal protein L3 glutamine methyltransferase